MIKEVIIHEMNQQKINTTELANMINISRQSLAKYLNNEGSIKVYYIEKIFDVLNLIVIKDYRNII